ncbi:hypothetical protein HOD29_06245 [archaeon]|jgi:hypothetical protein|nr:hypothetical protein [archaeon]
MRCGNQETCEDYKKYLENEGNDEGIVYGGVIVLEEVAPNVYGCKARENCSVVETFNLLERISLNGGKK